MVLLSLGEDLHDKRFPVRRASRMQRRPGQWDSDGGDTERHLFLDRYLDG